MTTGTRAIYRPYGPCTIVDPEPWPGYDEFVEALFDEMPVRYGVWENPAVVLREWLEVDDEANAGV